MDYTHHYSSPLGGVTLASDGEALIGLWFDGQKHFAETLAAEHEEKSLPVFDQADKWLELYFSGTAPDFTPPLRPRGTAFCQTVWDILRTIPYGETSTYGEIAQKAAERLGRARMSARAVGGAVGRNPLSLLIPCHRAVGAGGRLIGYAGGTEKKAWLLALEGAEATASNVPPRPSRMKTPPDKSEESGEKRMKTIRVVAAVIRENGCVFATQRGYGPDKDGWEFPGGKIEPGETPEQALIREIREELDAEISVGEKIAQVEYDYPEFHLSMGCYLCAVRAGRLTLKEHESARWLRPDEMDAVAWLPADREAVRQWKESAAGAAL